MALKRKIENTEDVLIDLLGYWKKVLRVPDFVIVVRAIKDTKSEAYVYRTRKGIIYCVIDPEKFVKQRNDAHDYIAAVFHELGHIKTNSFYSSKLSEEEAEFRAETQALKWLKKYLPERYKEQVNRFKKILKNSPWKGRQAHYTHAFKRIKDYND
jgi:hypothetical protein